MEAMAVEGLSLVAMGKTEVLGPWFSGVNALLKAASLYFGPSLPPATSGTPSR